MLQGSLENFALDEVLGLLAGTSKTGQLEIAGNRGTGRLTFSDGRLVDGTASYTANGSELEDVMFELLRYDDGTFSFNAGEVPMSAGAENVATVLATAESRLRDWQSIESIVPTLKHQVAPAPELPTEEVTIDRSEWAALTVIASGCPVSLVCDKLQLGEVEGSRQIKNLAERELITVTEPIGGYVAASQGVQSATEPPPPPPGFNGGIEAPVAPDPIGVETSFDAGLDASVDNGVGLAESMAFDPTGLEVSPAEAIAFEAPNFETPATETPTFDTQAYDASTFDASSTDGVLDSAGLMATDRPPMPPAPVADELQTDIPDALVPPAPPTPAEISSFGEAIEDASELESDDGKGGGGLLARYLKSDD